MTLEDPFTKGKKMPLKQPSGISKGFTSPDGLLRSSNSPYLCGTSVDFSLRLILSFSRPAPLDPKVFVLVLWEEPGQKLHIHKEKNSAEYQARSYLGSGKLAGR